VITRQLLPSAAVVLALALPAAADAAGVIPAQGQLIRVGTEVTGVCHPQSPERPLDLGADDDGTQYHGTYVYSAFDYVQNGKPGDPVTAGAWDPSISTSYRVPPTDGVTPDRCSFSANGRHLDSAPVKKRGLYVMHVITTNYHEHFDSVTGWVPDTDDLAETTEDVTFQVTSSNPCDSPWAGYSATAATCLKERQKAEAKTAAADYAKDLKTAQETYGGLSCGSSGLSTVGEVSASEGRETQFACAAAAARKIYDAQMESKETALAADPPVDDFRTLARASTIKLPTPVASARDLAAWRKAMLAEARIPGLLDALVLDINRANGAFVAGDEGWVVKQNGAARRDAATAHALLAQLPGLLRAAAGETGGSAGRSLRAQASVPQAAAAVAKLG
jgi:hypothetical protein